MCRQQIARGPAKAGVSCLRLLKFFILIRDETGNFKNWTLPKILAELLCTKISESENKTK